MKFPFSIFRISGHSMEPTLKSGQMVVSFNWVQKYKTGDVVVFKEREQIWVKRVAQIKNEEVFVEGDNKKDSLDSRKFGVINLNDILGKLVSLS